MAIMLLFLLIVAVLWFKPDSGIGAKIFGWVLALAVALVSCGGSYYMMAATGALDMITNSNNELKKVTSVYVLNNHVITEPSQLSGRTIGALNTINSEGTNGCIQALQNQGININVRNYDSSIQMVNDLKGQAIDGAILDQSYLSTIEDMEGQEKIQQEIVPVFNYEYTITKTDTSTSVNTSEQPFNVLISGIDTYGAIDDTSRSDVNILATINPKTHTILMISIPRDYYVETACDALAGCANGQMDKLTHTGLHGIGTTEMTLEKLFGIDINYNIRVNFSSLVNIIDELGGIDVYNVDSFTGWTNGYTYEPGLIHMNGDMALGFVRERYSFAEGDRERGKNQMRVLEAMIDKAISPAILTNFGGIMGALGNSFQTNMSTSDLTNFVNAQLSSGANWTIYNYSVDGTGGTDFAYELGDNAYVMYPDQATISNAKADIDAVKNGEVPPYINN